MRVAAFNHAASTLPSLLEVNQTYIDEYKHCALMQLIQSPDMEQKLTRERLLDCIQILSDYFQRTVMLRNALCDHHRFMPVTQAHLREEFEHNIDLKKDREFRPAIWDPILEATSAWFAWKMLTLDNEEKTLLIHLVLESSANIFFSTAHQIMQKHGETNYFGIHAAVDSEHEEMGIKLLANLTTDKYDRLMEVQEQGWGMINAACNRIALLTLSN
jgi:hypothetical protein